MADDFDPYYRWLAIPPEEQPADHYRLLGLKRFESAADVIDVAADRQMAHIRNFATGQHSDRSQELLNEIAAARLCLLSPKSRAAYDKQLRSKLAQKAKQVAAKKAAAAGASAATPTAPSALDEIAQIAPVSSPKRRTEKRSSIGPTWVLAAGCGALAVAGAIYLFAVRNSNAPRRAAATPSKKASSKPESKPFAPKLEPSVKESPPVAPVVVPPASKDEPSSTTPPQTPTNSPEGNSDARRSAGELDSTTGSAAADDAHVTPPATEKLAVPEAALLDQMLSQVKQRRRDDYAKARQPDEKRQLAGKLLGQVRSGIADEVERYVVLHEAARLFAGAGDADGAVRAVHQLDEIFEIDSVELLAELLAMAAKASRTTDEQQAVVNQAKEAIDTAVSQDRYDLAQQLCKSAGAAVARLKDPAAAQSQRDLARQVDQWEVSFRKIKPALETLVQTPDDADANLAVGKYFCFTKGDWQRGLPMLAQVSDESLRALAAADLAMPQATDERMRQGDAWWSYAAKAAKESQARIKSRAAHWYQQALPDLTGNDRTRVEKLLADAPPVSRPAGRRSVYLDDLSEQQFSTFYGAIGKHGRIAQPDHTPALHGGAAPAHSLAVHPPDSGLSYVTYQLDGKFSRLQAIATLIDWETPPSTPLLFKVLGDGKLLWQSRPIQNRVGRVGESQACDVPISGVRQLRLVVECPGSNSGADAIWIEPRIQ